jgi:salicylate hydroxylase
VTRGPRVLVAGGGVGGLTAALALLRQGCEVALFEQAAALREVGAGVQISANGMRALALLGVADELVARSGEASGKEIRLWSTGQSWRLFDLGAESVARYGFPYVMAYRPDLLATLVAAVRRAKPDAIRLGAPVVGFDEVAGGVRLRLEDGSTVTGDALVGADGVHSRIRHLLFGADRPAYTGLVAWRGVVPMERLPPHLARPVGTNWVGPGRHVVHYPLRRGALMNFVGVVERGGEWQVESWSARGTGEALAADFAGWHADVQALIRGVEVPYEWALMARPPLERWSVGRVTLLGDACHAMLPFMAQGAAQSIEDGAALAACLARLPDDVPEALRLYERLRLPRATRLQELSRRNKLRFHLPDGPAQAERDREMATHGDRSIAALTWLYAHDAAALDAP